MCIRDSRQPIQLLVLKLSREIDPFAICEMRGHFQHLKELRDINPCRAAAGTDADALLRHLCERADVGTLQDQKLEWRVVHRENGTHRPGGLARRPYPGAVLYTSDAADDLTRVDLGGRRIIKKKKKK